MATKPKPKPTPTENGAASPLSLEVMTLAEAATLLRVPEAGLLEDADAGRIPGRQVAGEWRFVKAALLRWLATAMEVGSSKTGEQEPHSRIHKSIPTDPDLNQGFLSSIGVFADDDTLEPMVEQIYRDRKKKSVGG